MKQQVKAIHEKEQEVGEDSGKKASLSGMKGIYVDSFDYDDTYKLPYGVGYDRVIKKKTDLINK